jgi:hypothetical protein
VGIEHGRGKIAVPEQVPKGGGVGAAWEQVNGGGTATGVSADGLRQTGTADGPLDGLVEDAGGHVMATGDPGTRGYGAVPGGEDRRPPPCRGGMGGFEPAQEGGAPCHAQEPGPADATS